MFVGPTGTGKTTYILSLLKKGMPAHVVSASMAFSAQTSANMAQDTIEGRLDKRRKGSFGPPAQKQMIWFVDDLNMPQAEKYGAQPPIELLRQWQDIGGWCVLLLRHDDDDEDHNGQ
jgi:dynein heavy chain, axonemal